jgi:phosphinothricin acetyltransferase
VIRPATDADAPAIMRLWNAMIRDTLATFTTTEKTNADITQMISRRRGMFWVAVNGTDLQGFATCGAFRAGPGYAATAEHTVIVAPEAHGMGVGRALMKELEKAARDAGLHVMIAAISSANPQAMRFHERLGYSETGRLPEVGRKAGQWLDLVLMQKKLGRDV